MMKKENMKINYRNMKKDVGEGRVIELVKGNKTGNEIGMRERRKRGEIHSKMN